MAQLRQDYDAFTARDAVTIAVGPDSAESFRRFWHENDIPFYGLADPKHSVAELYRQEVNILKLGRMPAQFIIDREGFIRFEHYGNSMSDIAVDEDVLARLDALRAEEG